MGRAQERGDTMNQNGGRKGKLFNRDQKPAALSETGPLFVATFRAFRVITVTVHPLHYITLQ